MSFVEKLVDFFSEEVKEIKRKGWRDFGGSLEGERLQNLSNASLFAYHSINYYIRNTPVSKNVFKEGVKASIKIDPITQLVSVYLTRGNLSSQLTYFSLTKYENMFIY